MDSPENLNPPTPTAAEVVTREAKFLQGIRNITINKPTILPDHQGRRLNTFQPDGKAQATITIGGDGSISVQAPEGKKVMWKPTDAPPEQRWHEFPPQGGVNLPKIDVGKDGVVLAIKRNNNTAEVVRVTPSWNGPPGTGQYLGVSVQQEPYDLNDLRRVSTHRS